jgi:transposase
VKVTLGVDVACRAEHQASLADERGEFLWSGARFRTRVADLDRLWARLPADAEVTVVLEPTRNAWSPLASWFTRRGARVVMVPSTQAADLRAYYSKHTKNDRLDSRVLARLPLLHPDGLRPVSGAGPADPLRRAARRRSSLVARRTAVMNRLDALVELLGPAWYEALGSDYEKTSLAVLAQYPNPEQLLRLGPARLEAFLRRWSRGQWGRAKAEELLDAARESIALWDGGLDFAALADDIRAEAVQHRFLTGQIDALETRIAELVDERDPAQILQSAPGVGPVVAGIIAARIGDPHRFTTLSAVRKFAGLVPSVSTSGTQNAPGKVTKSGDGLLRHGAFLAADSARRTDPQLAARYVRLMQEGRHHNDAITHLAAILLTRVVACWRDGVPYVIRDLDGTVLTPEQGRAVVAAHHQVDPQTRRRRRATRTVKTLKGRPPTEVAGRARQESRGAPTLRPATGNRTTAALRTG